jgi:hypothetical protein
MKSFKNFSSLCIPIFLTSIAASHLALGGHKTKTGNLKPLFEIASAAVFQSILDDENPKERLKEVTHALENIEMPSTALAQKLVLLSPEELESYRQLRQHSKEREVEKSVPLVSSDGIRFRVPKKWIKRTKLRSKYTLKAGRMIQNEDGSLHFPRMSGVSLLKMIRFLQSKKIDPFVTLPDTLRDEVEFEVLFHFDLFFDIIFGTELGDAISQGLKGLSLTQQKVRYWENAFSQSPPIVKTHIKELVLKYLSQKYDSIKEWKVLVNATDTLEGAALLMDAMPVLLKNDFLSKSGNKQKLKQLIPGVIRRRIAEAFLISWTLYLQNQQQEPSTTEFDPIAITSFAVEFANKAEQNRFSSILSEKESLAIAHEMTGKQYLTAADFFREHPMPLTETLTSEGMKAYRWIGGTGLKNYLCTLGIMTDVLMEVQSRLKHALTLSARPAKFAFKEHPIFDLNLSKYQDWVRSKKDEPITKQRIELRVYNYPPKGIVRDPGVHFVADTYYSGPFVMGGYSGASSSELKDALIGILTGMSLVSDPQTPKWEGRLGETSIFLERSKSFSDSPEEGTIGLDKETLIEIGEALKTHANTEEMKCFCLYFEKVEDKIIVTKHRFGDGASSDRKVAEGKTFAEALFAAARTL